MKLQVGDRIRDYTIRTNPRIGTVTQVFEDGSNVIEAQQDDKAFFFAHIKCVRKLVKKKRREIWIGEYNDEKTRMAWFPTKEQVPVQLIDGSVLVRAIRFVEAKEGK